MADHDLLTVRQRTWSGFVKLIVYSSAATVLVLVGMAIFLL